MTEPLERSPSCGGVIDPRNSECRCSGRASGEALAFIFVALTLIVGVVLTLTIQPHSHTVTRPVTPPACAQALTAAATQVGQYRTDERRERRAMGDLFAGRRGRALADSARVSALGPFTMPGGCG